MLSHRRKYLPSKLCFLPKNYLAFRQFFNNIMYVHNQIIINKYTYNKYKDIRKNVVADVLRRMIEKRYLELSENYNELG